MISKFIQSIEFIEIKVNQIRYFKIQQNSIQWNYS